MHYFHYNKHNLLTGHRLLGVLLILAGILALVSPLLFTMAIPLVRTVLIGIGFTSVGVMLASAYEGTTLDFKQLRIRNYFSFLGIKLGKWEKLPLISEVRLVSNTYTSTNTSNGIHPTLSGRITEYRASLMTQESGIPFYSFIYAKEKTARTKAEIIAGNLNVQLKTHIQT